MTNLLLEITKAPEGSSLLGQSIPVDTHGLSIGRADSNELMLTDDPSISKQHAIIQYQDRNFYIYDTSTNGVYLSNENKPLNMLDTGNAILTDQESIRIGGYIMVVKFIAAAKDDDELDVDSLLNRRDDYSPILAEEPAHFSENHNPLKEVNLYHDMGLSDQFAKEHNNEFDLETFLRGKVPIEEKFDPAEHFDANSSAALKEHGFAPERHYKVEDDLLPENVRPDATFDLDKILQEPIPAAAIAATVNENTQLENLLSQLGLQHYKVNPAQQEEILAKLAAIIQSVLQSMVDSTHRRQEALQQAGLESIIFKPSDNNPFLLSANASEALGKLLFAQDNTYLSFETAIKECFADLENYQDKLNHVAEQKLQQTKNYFAPEKVQEVLQNVETERGLLGSKKLANFDAYREYYQKMDCAKNKQI